MKIRKEIEKHSDPQYVECLLWLFSKYHYQSQWNFVARAELFGSYGMGTEYIKWSPTIEGIILFNHKEEME